MQCVFTPKIPKKLIFPQIVTIVQGTLLTFIPKKVIFPSKCASISSTILTFLPNNPVRTIDIFLYQFVWQMSVMFFYVQMSPMHSLWLNVGRTSAEGVFVFFRISFGYLLETVKILLKIITYTFPLIKCRQDVGRGSFCFFSNFLWISLRNGKNFGKKYYINISPNVPSPFILPCLRIPVPSMNRKPVHVVTLQPNSYK